MTNADDSPSADGSTPTDADETAVRTWLVERQYDDGGMVTLVYATPDGRRRYRTQFSAVYLESRSVTAGREVDPRDLDSVPEADRERYREEVERVRTRHALDDEV